VDLNIFVTSDENRECHDDIEVLPSRFKLAAVAKPKLHLTSGPVTLLTCIPSIVWADVFCGSLHEEANNNSRRGYRCKSWPQLLPWHGITQLVLDIATSPCCGIVLICYGVNLTTII
jgi:hypothetical protein